MLFPFDAADGMLTVPVGNFFSCLTGLVCKVQIATVMHSGYMRVALLVIGFISLSSSLVASLLFLVLKLNRKGVVCRRYSSGSFPRYQPRTSLGVRCNICSASNDGSDRRARCVAVFSKGTNFGFGMLLFHRGYIVSLPISRMSCRCKLQNVGLPLFLMVEYFTFGELQTRAILTKFLLWTNTRVRFESD